MKTTLGVLGVVAYVIAGLLLARYVHTHTRYGIPDPFAFLYVVAWPLVVVVGGIGMLVRGGA